MVIALSSVIMTKPRSRIVSQSISVTNLVPERLLISYVELYQGAVLKRLFVLSTFSITRLGSGINVIVKSHDIGREPSSLWK